jgi:hypothetical protein
METHEPWTEQKQDLHFVVPVTECEKIVEADGKSDKVRVAGTCLVPTISRNGNKYELRNLKENDGKSVKFFMQEHGILAVENVVGKVDLKMAEDKLMYSGILRNTAKHPDVVEHALNKEIDVSIDARPTGQKIEIEGGRKVFSYAGVDIRALCGVGVGGIPENSMELAIEESFNPFNDDAQTDNFEVNKVDETEQLKTKVAEYEAKIKVLEETENARKASERNAVVKEILKLNSAMKESELAGKGTEELNLILGYEKKLKESESKLTGAGEGRESKPVENDGIVINENEDTITMNDSLYAQFRKDLENPLYR